MLRASTLSYPILFHTSCRKIKLDFIYPQLVFKLFQNLKWEYIGYSPSWCTNTHSTEYIFAGCCFAVVFSLAQLSPILCVSMDCSPSGPSVHGIIPGRILEWVAISSSRGSSRPSDYFPHLLHCRQIIDPWATRKPSVGWGKDYYSRVSSSVRQLIAILKWTAKSIIFSEISYPIYRPSS